MSNAILRIANRTAPTAAVIALLWTTAAAAEFERRQSEVADVAAPAVTRMGRLWTNAARLGAGPGVVVEGDSVGNNHYILECGARCLGNGPTVAIGGPLAVVADSFWNVYFSGMNIVYKLDPFGTVTRVAGNGTPGYSGDGGPARDALLYIPFDQYPEMAPDPIDYDPLVGGLATDAAGNLFIADAYNNRVRRVGTDGIISSVIGSETIGSPQGVAVDVAGNLYVSSTWGTLSKIALNGTTMELAHNNCGNSFQDRGFCAPAQIAIDNSGAIYVPDAYCRVRKVTTDGAIVTVAGDESPSGHWFAFTCGNSGDGGPAVGAALSNMPYAVAVDTSGNLYIADTYNHCIRKVDGSGTIAAIAGICGQSGYAGDGGPATRALLNTPFGVAVDGAGNVYVADTKNGRVRMITPDGIISTIAGNGNG